LETTRSNQSQATKIPLSSPPKTSITAEDFRRGRRPSSLLRLKSVANCSVSSCICGPGWRACSFLHLFCPTRFSDGVFSEAYERAVMRTILVAKVIDRAGPLPMYSATMLCCTNQTKLAEGLLLGEWPAHVVNGPRMATQGPICKSYTHKGAGRKLPPPPLLYIGDPRGQGSSLPHEHFTLLS